MKLSKQRLMDYEIIKIINQCFLCFFPPYKKKSALLQTFLIRIDMWHRG